MLRITPLGFAAVAVVAVLALVLGLLNWGRGSFSLAWAERGSEENARLRLEVEELKAHAKDHDATIQAMRHEMQHLRGELKGALAKLEAARREPSVEVLSDTLKAASERLASESAQKVKALHDAARLAEEVAGLKQEAQVLQARIAELEKGR